MQRKQQGYLAQNKYLPPTSLADAVSRNQRAISFLRRQKSDELMWWVKKKLIEVFTYLGAFGKITDFQLKTLAQRICDKFYYITPAELDFFFVAFTNGEYRKLYGGDTVNPQDIMMSLVEYEKDLLYARGIAEEKRQAEEEAHKRAEEMKKPHGLEAWKIYCRKNGLYPETHTIPNVTLHNVNEELYPKDNKK